MAEFRHFLFQNTRSQQNYISTQSGGCKKNSPPRPERKTHADKLLNDLAQAEKKAKARQKTEPAHEGIQFIPMVFDESSDFDLEQQQLENTSPGAQIVSAKERNGRKEYLIAVPDSEVGMGVPNLNRARRSASGFTTMVIQDELQPFVFGSSENASNEMHLHDLPIPREVLEELGNTEVRMRVTLSYFIEPNPPRRGYVARYQYASHGLRFSVRRPQETPERMRKRLSRTSWDTDADGKRIRPPKGSTITDDRNWNLGPETVAVRGSVHSDCWTGTAAQLASSNLIAVHPVTGWWRYRRDQEIVERKARYSLIVSLSTNDTSLDLYAMVESEIRTSVAAQTETVITEIENS